MTFEEFETLVGETVDSLPERFRKILSKNEISVIPRQKVPSPLKTSHKGKIVFGVFIGLQLGRFTDMQTEPTRIELYKESFERVFEDAAQMKQQIRDTVIHEIAHYFGFSEKQIRKLGY